MRDGPFHGTVILAGLWGGKNYVNMTRAIQIQRVLFSVKPSEIKSLDQDVLRSKVWPLIKNETVIHDSYTCTQKVLQGQGLRPWPSRRVAYAYVGYGPTKDGPMQIIKSKECPKKCRPPNHQDWKYC